MDYDKIGQFLKSLRLSKNMSQYELAEEMHVDHSKINRLENNKRRPTFDDLVYYSQIFEISLDELIACERKNNQNEEKLQNTFLNYLKSQNSKYKKIKIATILLTIFSIISFMGLITLYFFQNYDTMRAYTFSGSSESYELTNGLLILSKKKIYFQIGRISPEVQNVTIFSEINNERKLIYNGDYHVLLQDSYGYEAFLSYQDFIEGKQKFIVVIGSEEILLNFNQEVSNNNFVYVKEKKIGEKQETKRFLTPTKIKENFQCDEYDSCTLIKEKDTLVYSMGFFYVNNDVENYTYDLRSENLSYSNFQKNISFEITNNNVNCMSGNCEEAKKIYEKFYKSYVEKYLK